MSAKRKNGDMWQYLDKSGVLEKGTDEEIKAAKKAYRKEYFLKFKRRQRAVKSEFTISLSNHNGEYGKMTLAAKNHKQSITAFIKEAAFAYINQSFVIRDKEQIAQMELLLSNCLNEVKQIVKGKERFFWDRDGKFEKIENRIIELQNKISMVLRNPPLLQPHDRKNKVA